MKLLYDFYPKIDDTTSCNITGTNFGSSSETDFGLTNLFSLEPMKCVKSASISEASLTLTFSSVIDIDCVFLNRINFSECDIRYGNTTDDELKLFGSLSSLKKDELADEKYVHAVCVKDSPITGVKRIKITVPANKVLFSDTVYKIGNLFVGKTTKIMNPKSGFGVTYKPKIAVTEFKSGYVSTARLGRTRRVFDGDFDKLQESILNKLKLTYEPFMMYLDFKDDIQACYLVRCTDEYKRTYDFAKVQSMGFSFEEIA